jgi:hypothetical protein
MPAKQSVLADFNTGVVLDRSPWNVPDTALTDARNVTHVDGAVVKRWGFKSYRPAVSGRVQRFVQFAPKGAASQELVLSTAGLFRWAPPSWTSLVALAGSADIVGSVLVSANSSVANGPRLLVCNGVDQIRFYDGATVYTNSTVPYTARFAIQHPNSDLHVLLGYVSEGTTAASPVAPNGIQRGTVPHSSGVTVAFTLVYLPTADPITGMVLFGGVGVCLTQGPIYVLIPTGTGSDFRAEERVRGAGCVAPGSVHVTPIGVLYLGADSVYLFNGTTSQPAMRNLRPLVRRITTSAWPRVVSVFDPLRGEYWLAVPVDGATDPNIVLVLNIFTGATSVYDLSPVGLGLLRLTQAAMGFAAGTLSPALATLSGGNSSILELSNTVGDGATAIDGWMVTKAMTFGSQAMKKILYCDLFFTRPQTGSMDVVASTSDDGMTWQDSSPITVSYAGSARVRVALDHVPSAVYLRLKLRNANVNEELGVRAITIHYQELGNP